MWWAEISINSAAMFGGVGIIVLSDIYCKPQLDYNTFCNVSVGSYCRTVIILAPYFIKKLSRQLFIEKS